MAVTPSSIIAVAACFAPAVSSKLSMTVLVTAAGGLSFPATTAVPSSTCAVGGMSPPPMTPIFDGVVISASTGGTDGVRCPLADVERRQVRQVRIHLTGDRQERHVGELGGDGEHRVAHLRTGGHDDVVVGGQVAHTVDPLLLGVQVALHRAGDAELGLGGARVRSAKLWK